MAKEIEYGKEGGILTAIKEGMDVYDVAGEEVGEVDFVYFGTMQVEEDPLGVAPATAEGGPLDTGPGETWVGRLADILSLDAAEEFPEEVAERLLRSGFIRVDAGFLSGDDSFIFPEQVAGVDEDGVHLRVASDDLVDEW